MSTVEKSIRLYAWKTNYQTFRVVQGEDDSRKFNIQLFSTTIPVDLTNCSVKFFAVKPDQTKVYVNCDVIDADNGLISLTLDEQMCAVEGIVDCWVQVIGDGGTDLRFEGLSLEVSACDLEGAIEGTESADDMKAFLQESARLAAIETEVKNARAGKTNLREKQDAQDKVLTDTAAAIRQEITAERTRIDKIVNQTNITGIQRMLLVSGEKQISNKEEMWEFVWMTSGISNLESIKTKYPFVIDVYLREAGTSNVGISMDTRYQYSINTSSSTNLIVSVTFTNNNVASENAAEKTYNVEACVILGYDCDIPEENNEIADLRIDVDGNTHESAGSAVRSQIRSIQDTAIKLDDTLTDSTKAAPADKVGELKKQIETQVTEISETVDQNTSEVTKLKDDLSAYDRRISALESGGSVTPTPTPSASGMTSEQAIILCDWMTEHVVMNVANAESLYSRLTGGEEEEPDEPTPPTPTKTLTGITVTWNSYSADVGTNTKTLISSVKANYSDGTSETVTGYTVTPTTIASGTNYVVVNYQGKTSTTSITGNEIVVPDEPTDGPVYSLASPLVCTGEVNPVDTGWKPTGDYGTTPETPFQPFTILYDVDIQCDTNPYYVRIASNSSTTTPFKTDQVVVGVNRLGRFTVGSFTPVAPVTPTKQAKNGRHICAIVLNYDNYSIYEYAPDFEQIVIETGGTRKYAGGKKYFTETLKIGNVPDANDQVLKGTINRFEIYDRELTNDEVLEWMGVD